MNDQIVLNFLFYIVAPLLILIALICTAAIVRGDSNQPHKQPNYCPPYRKLQVGQKIKIISWPNQNGVDGYAGCIGVVKDIDYTEKGKRGIGWIDLQLESGVHLCGVGLNNLKYELL